MGKHFRHLQVTLAAALPMLDDVSNRLREQGNTEQGQAAQDVRQGAAELLARANDVALAKDMVQTRDLAKSNIPKVAELGDASNRLIRAVENSDHSKAQLEIKLLSAIVSTLAGDPILKY